MLQDDIRDVFASSEYMDEERIEAIVNAVNIRIEELQDMVVERGKHFPAR